MFKTIFVIEKKRQTALKNIKPVKKFEMHIFANTWQPWSSIFDTMIQSYIVMIFVLINILLINCQFMYFHLF